MTNDTIRRHDIQNNDTQYNVSQHNHKKVELSIT